MTEREFDTYTYVNKNYFCYPSTKTRIYGALLKSLEKIAEREGYSLMEETVEYSYGEDPDRKCLDSYKVTIKARFSLN